MAVSRTDVSRRVAGSRVAGWVGPSRLAGNRLRRREELAFLLDGWAPPPRSWPATEAEALGLPAFGRGVDIIAGVVAGTHLRAFRWDEELGVHQRLAEQPAVLTDPYPLSDPWQWKYGVVNDLVLFGNAFGLPGDPDWRTARPGWLVPVPADEVWILTDDPGRPSSWRWAVGGATFGAGELFHISAGARSGEVLGRGVLRQYADALGGSVSAESHAGGYFAGGAMPPAVLQSPVVVTQGQADDLKAKWREMTNTREPVILPQGYTLTPLVSNAEQAQLVQSRQWNAQLAAMVLGIPPWLLGLPGTSMTYQNVEFADIALVRDTVSRWSDPIAAAVSKWLLPAGTEAMWDWTRRQRADAKTTAQVLALQVKAGIRTTDEARAVLGLPPLMSTMQSGTTPVGVPELTPEEIQ